VTPDRELRVANACQNRDLFFALRGGMYIAVISGLAWAYTGLQAEAAHLV
jgi:hypothetical protein